MAETARARRAVARRHRRRRARKEDDRLLRGDGRFTDDVDAGARAAHGRRPLPVPARAHRGVDVSAGARAGGRRRTSSSAPTSSAATSRSPCCARCPAPPSCRTTRWRAEVASTRASRSSASSPSSRHVAEDAVELDRGRLRPAAARRRTSLAALAPDAPVLHPDVSCDSNLLVGQPAGRGRRRGAARRRRRRGRAAASAINRVTGLPMETRAVVAEWRPGARELTVHRSTQVPHLVRMQLAESLRLDEGEVRVVASDVGGGFGLKLGVYPEDVLACLHACELRRPVKWIEDRLEHFRATTHAPRGGARRSASARPPTGAILGDDRHLRDRPRRATTRRSAPRSCRAITFTGPYRRDATARRAARRDHEQDADRRLPRLRPARGRTSPASVLIDRLARQLGRDPLELRLQNMLAPGGAAVRRTRPAPSTTAATTRSCLRMAADAVGYEALRAAGRGPRADGRYVGVGLTSFVERTGYASAKFLAARGSRFGAHESVTLRANRSGGIDLYTRRVQPSARASRRPSRRSARTSLGIALRRASRVHAGDTAASPLNTGAFASRTMIAAAGRDASRRRAALRDQDAAHRRATGSRSTTRTTSTIAGRDAVCAPTTPRRASASPRSTSRDHRPGHPRRRGAGPRGDRALRAAGGRVRLRQRRGGRRRRPETGDFEIERFVMVHDCGDA